MNCPYYTPKNLAQEIGQSERTARRVLKEQGIKHERGQWWRFDELRQKDAVDLCEVRAALMRGIGRYGGRRRPKGTFSPRCSNLDLTLF